MTITSRLAVALMLAAMGSASQSAVARPIDSQTHRSVKRDCQRSGGVYWSEGPTTATYGCIRPNGSGIVCGGVTAQEKRTCDTFRESAFLFPTRDEAAKLDKAEK